MYTTVSQNHKFSKQTNKKLIINNIIITSIHFIQILNLQLFLYMFLENMKKSK